MSERAESWLFAHERKLLEAASEDLPNLDLLTQAGLAIGFARERLVAEAVGSRMATALALLGSMGYRTARAGAIVIAAGYASEAFAHCRRLWEIAARVEYIASDRSGQRAQAWLSGRGGKAARLVGRDPWDYLSAGAHADPEHVEWMSRRAPEPLLYFFAGRDTRDDLVVLAIAVGASKRPLLILNVRAGLSGSLRFERLTTAIPRCGWVDDDQTV